MTQARNLRDHLLSLRRCGRSVAGQGRKTSRFALETLDALEEIKRPQRRRPAHRGKYQHQDRDDGALVVFLHEVQAVVDQRQEDEVGEKPIGVAQEYHAWFRPRQTRRAFERTLPERNLRISAADPDSLGTSSSSPTVPSGLSIRDAGPMAGLRDFLARRAPLCPTLQFEASGAPEACRFPGILQ
jgi:hypothetical protein